MSESRAHIVVVGNEKGGSGKSTTSVHLIAGLLHAGFRVGALDLDVGQATLTRFVANRAGANTAGNFPMPDLRTFAPSSLDSQAAAQAADAAAVTALLAELAAANHFVVIDTPGSDSALSRFGHSFADTLVTPLNDSFVDLDLLATIDPETHRVLRPSRYAEMVWEQKKAKALRDGGSIDWVVMRNRLATLDSRNNRAVEGAIAALSKRIGFRLADGFRERVIYRELFLKGLTLLDLRRTSARLNMSHVAARQEVRQLLRAIGLADAAPAAVPDSDRAENRAKNVEISQAEAPHIGYGEVTDIHR